MSMLRRVGTMSGAMAAVALCGCPRSGTNGLTADTMLSVTNAGQSPVRIGLDRSYALNLGQTSQPAGTITDLTPLLQPGESATLPLSGVSTVERFDVYVIFPDREAADGPFRCEIDRNCLDAGTAQAIWTGSSVLCVGLNDALVELANTSSETVYLLIDDEQPQLPLLPLAPGERRFIQVSRSAAVAATFEARAVTFDPILGARVAAFTQCPLFGICESVRVSFDGQVIMCAAAN